jgi:hypothetical protein
MLHCDSNTSGYTGWFYFAITGMKPSHRYQFNIMNFRKKHALFQQGMKMTMFDGQDWKWLDVVYDYYENGLYDSKGRPLYSLSWKMQGTASTIYLARQVPYSYSSLLRLIMPLNPK